MCFMSHEAQYFQGNPECRSPQTLCMKTEVDQRSACVQLSFATQSIAMSSRARNCMNVSITFVSDSTNDKSRVFRRYILQAARHEQGSVMIVLILTSSSDPSDSNYEKY